MDARENGRTQTRLSSSVNARSACASFSTQDSLEIRPLIGVDQKRPASDQNGANSPKRTLVRHARLVSDRQCRAASEAIWDASPRRTEAILIYRRTGNRSLHNG
jgi:hypothetical protein